MPMFSTVWNYYKKTAKKSSTVGAVGGSLPSYEHTFSDVDLEQKYTFIDSDK